MDVMDRGLDATHARIAELKKKFGSDLVILGHHYQADEIIRHVDIVGDSLELARRIPDIEARSIVFCGVYFMAESAALLARPGQKVYLPDHSADCAMARMARASDVERVLEKLAASGRKVVPLAYVNSSLAVKAVVGRFGGAVCTSSNAETMLKWATGEGDAVLFLPDRNLGRNTARVLGIPAERQALISASGNELDSDEARNAKLLLWPGCCPIHESLMKPDMVDAFHSHFPGCRVLVHPECTPEVVERCDGAGSTAYLIKEVEKAAAEGREQALCIGTEFHLVHRLMERHAGRINIIPLAQASCPDMEKVDAEKLLATLESLENGAGEVVVEEAMKEPARKAVVRMLEHCR
ncbi:quinolinate synthase NadA [Mailhella massiliensis]|uniref:quinolinate synthase n=1 Tax=Mailhella massiliensis TaxID=1903261 RepID=A0A921AW10_9BACT|nr:quinolinate synthase NadA [Mailhella massiliensis]HJD97134.1 quinolinate synthase NadA [Mailhella massiliensis]